MKNILTILITTLIGLSFGFAQCDIVWQKSVGDVTQDQGAFVIPTSDNNLIFTGSLGGAYIEKRDKNGDTLWTKYYNNFLMNRVLELDDGGFVFLGKTTHTNIDNYHGDWDIYITRTDELGNKIWEKCYGSTEVDYEGDIIDGGNGLYITGYVGAMDGDVSSSTGTRDIWLLYIDYDGNIIWEKTYGSNDHEGASAIQIHNNNIYISGSTSGNDLDFTGNYGYVDAFVICTDTSGNLQWSNCYGGSYNDYCYDMVVNDHGIFICGNTKSVDYYMHEGNQINYKDIFLIKLDANGDSIWSHCYGGSFHETAYVIEFSPADNSFLMLGNSMSDDFTVNGNYGESDIFLAKVTANGVPVWFQNYGGSLDEFPKWLYLDTNSELYFIGYSYSSDYDLSVNYGFNDIWLGKFSNHIGIPIVNDNEHVFVFPNPAKDHINITIDMENMPTVDMIVYSLDGKKVVQHSLHNNHNLIGCDHLTPGFYILEIEQLNYRKKIVIQ